MNRMYKLFSLILVAFTLGWLGITSWANATTADASGCGRSFSNIDDGIAVLVNEKLSELMEKKRLYEAYLAPGQILSSPGFQVAMRHLYIRLNSGADVPTGAKAFGKDIKTLQAAGLVDGRMFYKVIAKDPKHAANLIIDTLGTLFYTKDLFPEGRGSSNKEDNVESAKELQRRAGEMGFTTSEYIKASKEITALLDDSRKNAELVEFMIHVLPDYGPIVVKQALNTEPAAPGKGGLARTFSSVLGIGSRMSSNRAIKDFHTRWSTELKTGIDELATTYGLSANEVEHFIATHKELKTAPVLADLKINIPAFDILEATEAQVKSINNQIEDASNEFYRSLAFKVPLLTDPKSWSDFEKVAKHLQSEALSPSKLLRTLAISQLGAPISSQQSAVKGKLAELDKLIRHLDKLEKSATEVKDAAEAMQATLENYLTIMGQEEATPNLVALDSELDLLQTDINRLQATRTQLDTFQDLLNGQLTALKILNDGLLYPENIGAQYVTPQLYEHLENMQKWATRSISNLESGKPMEPMKLINAAAFRAGSQ